MAYPESITVTDMPPGLLEKAFPGLHGLEVDPRDIGFAPSIGFLALKPVEPTGSLHVLGVYTSSQPLPEDHIAREVTVPSSLEDIDAPYHKAGRVGKGVLGRVWNTQNSSLGWIDNPDRRGLYSLSIEPQRLHYATDPFSRGLIQDVHRSASHAQVLGRSQVGDLSEVFRQKHEEYGDNQAMFMTVPLRPRLRGWLRGAWSVPPGMGASFIAPLEPGTKVIRVGIITR